MQYDVAIIGSGPGGYVCALRASQLGLKTVCIEESPFLGGTCLHVGCIPSKTLLHSSELYAKFAEETEKYGVTLNEHAFDFQALMKYKNEIIAGLAGAIKTLFQKYHIDVVRGRGKLQGAHTVLVTKEGEQKQVSANSLVLATGSFPVTLPFLPFDEKKILSSTGALSLETVPKKMVVVGAGVVGVELASVYSRLGTEVIVIEVMPSICTGVDRTLTTALYQILKRQKIEFYLNTQVVGAKDLGNEGIELLVESVDGSQIALQAEKVLVAIGRRPSSNDLGLSELNVDMTGRGAIIVDSHFRSTVPNIYAIGDLIEGTMLAHRASVEAIAVAEIIAGRQPKIDYMTIPNVIYTNPELATVGLTDEEAKDLGRKLLIGQFALRGNPRARASGNLDGLVKVVADAESQRILGLHILASHASEMIAIGSLALAKKVTLSELGELPFPHPTYSEAIKEACLHALGTSFYH